MTSRDVAFNSTPTNVGIKFAQEDDFKLQKLPGTGGSMIHQKKTQQANLYGTLPFDGRSCAKSVIGRLIPKWIGDSHLGQELAAILEPRSFSSRGLCGTAEL